jgi:hypothetical protein
MVLNTMMMKRKITKRSNQNLSAKKKAKKSPAKKQSAGSKKVKGNNKVKDTGKKKPPRRSVRLAATYKADDVIRIILDVAGKQDISVTTPKIRSKKLEDNLDYTDNTREILEIELDKYVKSIKENKSVEDGDLDECETVEEVIEVIEEKLK